MIHAYDEVYVEDAQKSLGLAFDYAWYEMNYTENTFVDMFLNTKYASLFEKGNPSIVAGKSGFELCFEVVDEYTDSRVDFPNTDYVFNGLSPVYWAGWIIAWYQWYSARRFKEIFGKVSLSEIVSMYPVYHEMDVMRFYERMEEIFHDKTLPTNLAQRRKKHKMTQRALSEESGVGIKTIQMYEQRLNNIDNAQAHILYKLSRVLNCDISDLLENPLN